MLDCRLKIESNSHTITPNEGLSIKELSDILIKLSKCITNKNTRFILTGIEFKSYTPIISTETIEGVEEIQSIHSEIANSNYYSLNQPLKNYADTLKANLFDRGLYISFFDNRGTDPIVIKNIDATKKLSYSSITTINAKLTAVDGRGKKAFVIVQTLENEEIKLSVNPEQELELFKYYKGLNIRFRVKLKSDFDVDGQQTGTLLAFYVPNERDFLTAIQETNKEYPNIFRGIIDSVKILEDLRKFSND